MLVFGWRTAVLTLVSAQVLLIAASLVRRPRNRAANALLAVLLLVAVGMLTPFTIGFAGAYDRWPWLSFAPFATALWLGPLAWAYTCALATGRAPRRLWLHLLPGAVQFAYQSACFCLPLAAKSAWDDRVHEPFIDPMVSTGILVGLAAYSLAGLRLLRRYRTGLPAMVADEHRYALRWLSGVLAAVLAVLAVEVGYQLWEWRFGRLDYFRVFGLYLVLAAATLYLAVEGWRHADLPFPHLVADFAEAAPTQAAAALERPARDWRSTGAAWAARIDAEGWWREPELSLPLVAARLGTNTHHLSRALNEGLGLNFSALINGLRSRAVAAALKAERDGNAGDLLSLALDCGFSSKASFNRAFRAEWGVSPSDYRRHGVPEPKSSLKSGDVRRAEA